MEYVGMLSRDKMGGEGMERLGKARKGGEARKGEEMMEKR
jgi:hypothetical protein